MRGGAGQRAGWRGVARRSARAGGPRLAMPTDPAPALASPLAARFTGPCAGAPRQRRARRLRSLRPDQALRGGCGSRSAAGREVEKCQPDSLAQYMAQGARRPDAAPGEEALRSFPALRRAGVPALAEGRSRRGRNRPPPQIDRQLEETAELAAELQARLCPSQPRTSGSLFVVESAVAHLVTCLGEPMRGASPRAPRRPRGLGRAPRRRAGVPSTDRVLGHARALAGPRGRAAAGCRSLTPGARCCCARWAAVGSATLVLRRPPRPPIRTACVATPGASCSSAVLRARLGTERGRTSFCCFPRDSGRTSFNGKRQRQGHGVHDGQL